MHPIKLPKYALDYFVLVELCHQLAHVSKMYSPKNVIDISFLIELGSCECKLVSNTLNLKVDLFKFNFQFYKYRLNFDNKEFSRNHLLLRENFLVGK